MIKFSVSLSDETKMELAERTMPHPPPDTFPKYAQVKHFQELFGMSYLEYHNAPKYCGGLPEVFQYEQSGQKNAQMTRRVQEWMFSLLVQSAAGNGQSLDDIKLCWKRLYKGGIAYTNKYGFPACNDYINFPKTGDDGNDPKLGFILTCGATLKILREIPKAHGITWVEFETLNVSKINYSWTLRTMPPHLWMAGVNNVRDTAGGKYPNGWDAPWPGLNGRDVPIPLLSTIDTGYVDKQWIRYMSPDEPIPSYPYWPKMV